MREEAALFVGYFYDFEVSGETKRAPKSAHRRLDETFLLLDAPATSSEIAFLFALSAGLDLQRLG